MNEHGDIIVPKNAVRILTIQEYLSLTAHTLMRTPKKN